MEDQDRCMYAYSTQHVNNCELTPGTAHRHLILISQHYNFMLISVMYLSILKILIISVRAKLCLD